MNWISGASIAGPNLSRNAKARMKNLIMKPAKGYGLSQRSWMQTLGGVFFVSALAASARHEVYADRAYLPVVGPPSLRLETTPVHLALSSAKIFTPDMVKNTELLVPPIELPPKNTNTTIIVANSAPATTSDGNSTSPLLSLPPVTDDSVVTPQMLVDYLKPTSHGSVILPVNVGFTPPTPSVSQPSRATYKSE